MRSPADPSVPVRKLVASPAPQPLADLLLDVVTPMFGGGATARFSDDDLPIRPAAVRGNLRFWWRACSARAYATPKELFEAEAFFWGSAPEKRNAAFGPGAIGVAVELISAGAPTFRFHDTGRSWHNDNAPGRSGPSYALFPFQGDPQNPRVEGREGVRFRLTLAPAPHVTKPDDIDDCVQAAEQALWAWITFGGVGARTRRGCGTLWCRDNGPTESRVFAASFQPSGDTGTWLRDAAANLVWGGEGCPMVTALAAIPARAQANAASGGAFALGAATQHPIDAWRLAVEPMFTYRQGQRVGRNPGTQPNRPGQSRWPEAGSVRGMLPIPDGGHRVADDPAEQGFPRADLGYPILFQRMAPERAGTPTLEGRQAKAQRFASPIVLKALPVSATLAFRLAVLLDAPHVWEAGTPGVQLDFQGPPTALTTGQLDGAGRAWRPDSPLMGSHRSARSAFMDFVGGTPEPRNAPPGWQRPWSTLT